MKTCDEGDGSRCLMNDRRAFMVRAVGLVATAVAGVGAGQKDADAMPVVVGHPMAARADELTYPIPAADGATVDRDNGVIVVRFQGRVFAFNLSCPHENAAVRWKAALGRFECSRHDSVYSPAGVYTSGRATRNMDRFRVRRSGNTVVVDVSTLISSDRDRAAWDGAAIAV